MELLTFATQAANLNLTQPHDREGLQMSRRVIHSTACFSPADCISVDYGNPVSHTNSEGKESNVAQTVRTKEKNSTKSGLPVESSLISLDSFALRWLACK